MVEFLKEAAHVVPSKRQLDWFEMERYAFVHYGVNTYTDREWGEGTEDEKIFNPTALDCDQWVEAVKSAGLKGLAVGAAPQDQGHLGGLAGSAALAAFIGRVLSTAAAGRQRQRHGQRQDQGKQFFHFVSSYSFPLDVVSGIGSAMYFVTL